MKPRMNPIKSFLDKAFTREGVAVFGRNALWTLAERLLRFIVSLTIGALVARHLGPAKLGILSYGISILAIFTPIANMSIDAYVIRELINRPELREAILGTAFRLRLVSAVLAGLGVAWVALGIPHDPEVRLVLLIIGSNCLWMPFQVMDDHFQSALDMRASVLAQMVACLAVAAINTTGVVGRMPLVFFAMAEGANWLVQASGWAITYRRRGHSMLRWKYQPDIARQILNASWPLGLIGLMYILYLRLDQLLIKHFLGAQALGLYSIAARMTETCMFIPQMVSNVLFPAIVVAKLSDRTLFHKRLSQLYFLLIWSSVAVAALVSLLSGWIVQILYGPAFAISAHVLRIYIWAIVSFAVHSVFVRWCIADGRLLHGAFAHALAVIINLTANFLLIPRYGITASAYIFTLAFPLGIICTLSISPAGRTHLRLITYSILHLSS